MTDLEQEQYDKEMKLQADFLRRVQVMNDIEDGKHAFTLSELVKMDFENQVCLLDPILPSVGLVGIVGKPDSGKSMLARELTLRVALGCNEFLGYTLHAQNRRALYIVTEDGLRTSRDVMQRQYLSIMNQILEERKTAKEENPDIELPAWHPLEGMNNIEVLPASALTSKELIELLQKKIDEAAYDVIVIDAIADVLSTKDGNSNFQIRDGLKPFCSLAEKENLLMVFVGHINKSAYRTSPDQADVQGAAAFAQKARVILDLRADQREPNARYLAVTKGNAVAAEHKKIARRLHWNPQTFLSEYHGEVIALDMIGTAGPEKTFIEWSKYLQPGEQAKAAEIVRRIGTDVNLKERAIRDRIAAELHRVGYHYQLPGKEQSTMFEEPDVEAISPYMYD